MARAWTLSLACVHGRERGRVYGRVVRARVRAGACE